MPGKLWGGRFQSVTDKAVDRFNASIQFDKRLWKEDIQGSKAYCKMLGKQGIISAAESMEILNALEEISGEIEKGNLRFDDSLEDIHTHIEKTLVEKIGPLGEMLHAGRSRNDQIALDTRLYVRASALSIIDLIKDLQLSVIELAENNQDLIMPP